MARVTMIPSDRVDPVRQSWLPPRWSFCIGVEMPLGASVLQNRRNSTKYVDRSNRLCCRHQCSCHRSSGDVVQLNSRVPVTGDGLATSWRGGAGVRANTLVDWGPDIAPKVEAPPRRGIATALTTDDRMQLARKRSAIARPEKRKEQDSPTKRRSTNRARSRVGSEACSPRRKSCVVESSFHTRPP